MNKNNNDDNQLLTLVQFDNSALAVALNILNSTDKPSFSDLFLLAQLIQAIVFYDKIILTARPDRKILPDTYLPIALKHESLFKVHIVTDFKERIANAEKRSLNIARYTPEITNHQKNPSKGEILIASIEKSLNEDKYGWKHSFWNHIDFILKDESDYMKEAINKVYSHFENPEYSSLKNHEKMAIYYFWKCFYNIDLAVDIAHSFSSNYYRTPLANLVYESIRKELLVPSNILKIPGFSDLKSLEKYTIWNDYFPFLLSFIFNKVDKRTQIVDEILELRNSRPARSFRTHHRELIDKYKKQAAHDILLKEMKEFIVKLKKIKAPLDIFSSLSIPYEVPLGLPREIPGPIAEKIRKLAYKVRRNPMRIFMNTMGDNSIKMLYSNYQKIFG